MENIGGGPRHLPVKVSGLLVVEVGFQARAVPEGAMDNCDFVLQVELGGPEDQEDQQGECVHVDDRGKQQGMKK